MTWSVEVKKESLLNRATVPVPNLENRQGENVAINNARKLIQYKIHNPRAGISREFEREKSE